MRCYSINIVIVVLSLAAISGCSKEQEGISFEKQIMPILKENCLSCHQKNGEGYISSGFSVENYDGVMKGTKHGPVVQPGKSYASTIHILVNHKADPSLNMPRLGSKLSEDKLALIKEWIDQGAKNN